MRSTLMGCAATVSPLLFAIFPSAAQQAERQIVKTALCADQSCTKGSADCRPWELKRALPKSLAQCTTYRTTPFFAVILTRNVPDTSELDCDGLPKEYAAERGEAARKKAEALFKGRAVFLRMLCVSYGNYVEYAIAGESLLNNFLAVHAGPDRAAAKRLLGLARRHYPAPSIVSMTARLENGDAACP